MKDQYIFIITRSGDRSNILSYFQVITKEDFISVIKTLEKKDWCTVYRFAKIGGYAENVKFMSLVDFENAFTIEEIGSLPKEIITALFRKEVSEMYGTHSETKLMKVIPKKDLVPGQSYFTETGKEYFYFGRVKGVYKASRGYYINRRIDTFNLDGILHTEIKKHRKEYIDMKSALSCSAYLYFNESDVLKQNKKFLKLGTHKIEMEEFLTADFNDDYRIESLTLQFMDFKK